MKLKLVVDHTQVGGDNLVDFPIMVLLRDVSLQELPCGAQGLRFLAADGRTPLDHEVVSYDSADGRLTAWVRIPALTNHSDTVLFVCPGATGGKAATSADGVWRSGYSQVIHDGATVMKRPCVNRDALTVEAVVNCDAPRPEAMQIVAADWRPAERFGGFSAYRAEGTSGLNTMGFFGAVFDGRYVYFAPNIDREGARHGNVLRLDTQGDFDDPKSWTGYNAGRTDGLSCEGLYGGVYDGRYVFFIPRRDNEGFHSRFVRYDTRGEFTDAASWSAHDAGIANSYQAAAFDGRYIYCCPGQMAVPLAQKDPRDEGHSVTGLKPGTTPKCMGLILRLDTQGDFKSPASYVTYDAADTDGFDCRDFDGALFDGRYVYFCPLSYGAVLRYDTSKAFTDKSGWSAFNARPLGLGRSVGGVYDGRYVYFAPYGTTDAVVRCDTRGEFRDATSWSAYCGSRTAGRKYMGYDGGFYDGRYVYFIPFWDAGPHFHGELLRYDTLGEFGDPAAWSAFDATCTDGLRSIGFNAGVFDGRYAYFAPCNDGSKWPKGIAGSSVVLRYDTAGPGSVFKLLYSDFGHNGGLCAALPGPRFVVNTDRCVVSVAANRMLSPGRHYLAGVFDGQRIRLFIDGELANEQPACGMVGGEGNGVAVAALPGGSARFDGIVSEVRVSGAVRSSEWIRTNHRNMAHPEEFCRIIGAT